LGAKLTQAQREDLKPQVLDLSAKGWANPKIGKHLGIHFNTVSKLLRDGLAEMAEHRSIGEDRERAIRNYQLLVEIGWEKLEDAKLGQSTYGLPAILNSIRAAQAEVDKLTGVHAPIKYQDVDEVTEVVWDESQAPASQAQSSIPPYAPSGATRGS
jgi:hypothetical protein